MRYVHYLHICILFAHSGDLLANSPTTDNPVYDLGHPSGEEDERELDNPIYGLPMEGDSTYDMPGDTNHFDAVYSTIDT